MLCYAACPTLPYFYFSIDEVTSEQDVMAALEVTQREFGKLDALVNCAGVGIAAQTYNFNKNRCHGLKDFERVLLVGMSFLVSFTFYY